METAALIVIAQLSDAYIRWLAFSSKVSGEVKFRLYIISAAWGIASFVLYYFIFAQIGVTAATYKAILLLGWLPYFLICMKLIPWGFTQHLFVFGMGTIAALFQHSVSATIIVLNLQDKSDAEIIFLDSAIYLLLFAIFLPFLSQFFVKLLPSREFFDLRPQGIYIAVLPLIIISGHLILIADNILVHSWAERLSRMYLPVVFFFFYRYILLAANNFYELERLERNKHQIEEQLIALKEYNDSIKENQKFISVMRHDLRHNYNLIYALLESGNVIKAREHILTQKFLLESATVQTFCQSPIINAALVVYLKRAEEKGIQVSTKINLPTALETDDKDFALLLANLLGKIIATNATKLLITIRHVNGQCVLEVSVVGNFSFSDEMLNLFAKKYAAYVNKFSRDGKSNLLMYWRDGKRD